MSRTTNDPAAIADTVAISVDDQARRIAVGTSLADVVAQLGHAPNAVATAVNGRFVARASRANHMLQANDAVLMFKPIGGG